MKTYQSLIKSVALLLTLNLTACLETVNSDQVVAEAVHQSYHATFKEDTNSTEVMANFRVGGSLGTSIRLVDPSTVTANGVELNEGSLILGAGKSYRKSFDGMVSTVTTVWTDQDQNTYTNSIEIYPVTLSSYPSQVSNNQSFKVYFSAAGLSNSDDINVVISQNTGSNSTWASLGRMNASDQSVEVSSDDLKNFKSGRAQMHIVRTHSTTLVEVTEEGGYGKGIYETGSVNIDILDVRSAAPLAAH